MAREERRAHLRVRPDLEPILAMGALAPKAKDGRRQVVADLLLLGVVADASADVAVAGAAPDVEGLGRVARRRGLVSGRQQRQRFRKRYAQARTERSGSLGRSCEPGLPVHAVCRKGEQRSARDVKRGGLERVQTLPLASLRVAVVRQSKSGG